MYRQIALVSILTLIACAESNFSGNDSKQSSRKNNADSKDGNNPFGSDTDSNGQNGGTTSGDSENGNDLFQNNDTQLGKPSTNEDLEFDEEELECQKKVQGFVGKVYKLPNGTKQLPNFEDMAPVGEVESPKLDVPDRAWTSGFPGVDGLVEWFAISFEASLNVPEDGDYVFKTISDDGSKVYVDGKLVVNNDGTHGPRPMESSKVNLDEGDHKIKVEWFQGPRTQIALQVFWKKPGDGFEIIPAKNLSERKDCDLEDLGIFE